jgi:hypothetical protein
MPECPSRESSPEKAGTSPAISATRWTGRGVFRAVDGAVSARASPRSVSTGAPVVRRGQPAGGSRRTPPVGRSRLVADADSLASSVTAWSSQSVTDVIQIGRVAPPSRPFTAVGQLGVGADSRWRRRRGDVTSGCRCGADAARGERLGGGVRHVHDREAHVRTSPPRSWGSRPGAGVHRGFTGLPAMTGAPAARLGARHRGSLLGRLRDELK